MKSIELDYSKRCGEEPEKGHNRWHPDIPPVVEVDPGEEVVMQTRHAFDGQITPTTIAHDLLGTDLNPWPYQVNMDTRAGYGRRYGLSGKSFSQLERVFAYAADLMHLPEVVRSAHKTGVNVVYTDGHAQWVQDPGILTDNELTKPFDPRDNAIVKKIWKMPDRAWR